MLSRVIKDVLLAVGFLIYLLAGAMVFQMMEQDAEENVKLDTARHKLAFLTNYTCLTQDALEQLINVITDAVKHGVNPLQNGSSQDHTNWDFGSAFFFAGTVVTTIGYGTIAPRTGGGQIFCMFYALFGIPLNIIVLSHAGKTLSHWCKRFGKCLVRKGIKKKKAKILTIIFFLVTGTVVFLGVPPLVFTETETWTYREGVYYAFISLSTIGFGDYVVGSGPNGSHPFQGYRSLVCFWVLFGLAWLSLLINLLTSLLEDTEKKIAKDLRKKIENRKENGNRMAAIELKPLGQDTSETEPLDKPHK